MRRRLAEDDDLEALDPTTGDALAAGPSRTPLPTGDWVSWITYRRRLRRARVIFIVLSFASAGFAAYTGWSIATLRRVERTWRTAMAVDAVRQQTDKAIFEDLEPFEPDDDTTDSFLVGVGVAATSELAKAETKLVQQRIPDRRTAVLRDLMVKALEFRQRQMSPQRRQLGNTPLLLADEVLATELRRWRLEPLEVSDRRLAATDEAVKRLRRFVDEPTSTIIVAIGLAGRSLVTIDLDASTIERRELSESVERLLSVSPDVVITVGLAGVRAYEVNQPTSPKPIWERTGAAAYAPPGADSVWIHEGPDVLRLDPRGGVIAGPYPVPAGLSPVGATRNGLVLVSAPESGFDDVFLWSPEQDRRKLLAQGVRRVVSAGHGLVTVERRFVVQGTDGAQTLPRDGVFVVADTGRTVEQFDFDVPLVSAAQRPGGIEIAAAAGPLAGRLARVFRFTIPGSVATGGPSASVDPGALAWSNDGSFLFWVTPDGNLAIHEPARRRVGLVRSGGIPYLQTIVAFESQR